MSLPSLNHSMLSLARDAVLARGIVDVHERETNAQDPSRARFLELKLGDRTPALIYVSGCYRDEWIASIALCPTPSAREHMHISTAGRMAGEVFAWGWFNRWERDGQAICIERFHDASIFVTGSRGTGLAEWLASQQLTS